MAICLSGQPRTWRTAHSNIINFFDIPTPTGYDDIAIDYFMHVWNYNTWWRGADKYAGDDEMVSATELQELRDAYTPKSFAVDHRLPDIKLSWRSLLYSFMRSTHLKKKYEVENHFEYDIVVKCRYDVVFDPRIKFSSIQVKPLTAYTTNPIIKFPREYYQNDFHDVMFWGDSMTMDLMAMVERFYTGLSRIGHAQNRITNMRLGPGTLLYKHMVALGIHPQAPENCSYVYTVIREEAEKLGLDPMVWGQYSQIRNIMMQKI